jgi:hypothetical protein
MTAQTHGTRTLAGAFRDAHPEGPVRTWTVAALAVAIALTACSPRVIPEPRDDIAAASSLAGVWELRLAGDERQTLRLALRIDADVEGYDVRPLALFVGNLGLDLDAYRVILEVHGSRVGLEVQHSNEPEPLEIEGTHDGDVIRVARIRWGSTDYQEGGRRWTLVRTR